MPHPSDLAEQPTVAGRHVRSSLPVGAARIVVGVAVLAVLITGFVTDWSHQRHNPFNYFGYFTNLTSTLAAIILIAAGVLSIRRQHQPSVLNLLRAVATSCLIVVAVVYNVLVPGTGSAPAWVSIILHVVFPVLMLLDWILVRDHAPLPWRLLWTVLPYPLVLVSVVLVRGVTDGWVPYGFLLPERGPVSLALHVAGLTAALLIAAAIVWATGRFGRASPTLTADTVRKP